MKALACLLALVGTAALADRKADTVLMTENDAARPRQEQLGYADAIVHGDTIYLSGVVASLRPSETDMRAAFDRAFQRIAATLARTGTSWDDVVDMTTFHTDLPAQIDAFTEVKQRYVHAPFPAWTAIDVDRLLPDAGLVEIKVVAVRAKSPAPNRAK